MKTKGPRGGTFIECYSGRDGVRVGGLGRTELINNQGLRVETTEQRRQTAPIDVLYREWSRHRSDLEKLRKLQSAISDVLEQAHR